MSSATRHAAIGGFLALLAGCGGGGGDGGGPAASAPLAEITSQNAPVIAGSVAKATVEGSGLGSFAGAGSGAAVNGPSPQLFAALGQIQKSQNDTLAQKARSGELRETIPPQTDACLVSGTVTTSGQVSNPLTLSPADTFTLVFSACDDGAGVIDGTYSMRVTSFSGDFLSGSFSLGVTVTLTGFAITDALETITAQGSLSMSLDYTAAPQLSISMTSTSLTVSDGVSSETLSSFSLTQTLDELTGSYSMTVSGSLTSTAFSGRVNFSTSATLLGDEAAYAYSGEITISGAGSASIDVIVLDDTLVRLEIDLNGDGVPDEILDTTWDALVQEV